MSELEELKALRKEAETLLERIDTACQGSQRQEVFDFVGLWVRVSYIRSTILAMIAALEGEL